MNLLYPRKPNLFVIGAMKAGTTSLCRQLSLHSQIYMAPVKETFFFSNKYKHTSISTYLNQFEGADKERYVAEGTADYSSFPTIEGVPERIYAFNPESRFIYLIRDPLERAISHYQHFVLEGRENRSLKQALVEEPSYLWRSYYAVQLRNYLRYFDRRQILVVSFDKYRTDPLSTLNEVFAWLDLDSWKTLNTQTIKANETLHHKTVLDPQAWSVQFARYLKRYKIIQKFTPQSLTDLYRSSYASKKEINFDSPEFQAEVESVRKLYLPMVYGWEHKN